MTWMKKPHLAGFARAGVKGIELLIRAAEFDEAESESAALESEARAEGDDVRLLVALHHRGRIALRRGHLEEASRWNAAARRVSKQHRASPQRIRPARRASPIKLSTGA